MATPDRTRNQIAERRATVAQYLRDGLTQTAIAARLGISVHAVWRDTRAIRRDQTQAADQPNRAPTTTTRDRIAARTADADTAMRAIAVAVADVIAASPSHVIVSPAIAHRWVAELRQHADHLTALADAFNECYPTPTETTAG